MKSDTGRDSARVALHDRHQDVALVDDAHDLVVVATGRGEVHGLDDRHLRDVLQVHDLDDLAERVGRLGDVVLATGVATR